MSDYVLLADSAMDDVRLVCRAAVSGVMDGDALAALHRTEAMLSRLDGQTGPDQAPPLYNMAGDLVAGSEPEERVCDTCDGSGDVPLHEMKITTKNV